MRTADIVQGFATALAIGSITLAATGSATAQTAARETDLDAPQQLVTVLHVHSTASSGTQTLVQLARLARESGVDALVLTENLGYEFRYAPGPLRLLVEASASTPTLERYGIGRYFAELEKARKAEPGVMLLPGVEVPPYYYWTGSLLTGDLTLNDMQRNVLVLPAVAGDDPAAAAQWFLRDLPVVGNRNYRHYGLRSLALLLPGVLFVALSLHRLRQRTFEPSHPRTWLPLAVLVSGACLLWVNFPFKVPSLEPYDPGAGHRPVQRLFDYARAHGALAFWSMPEAGDYRERAVGPVTVRLSTAPYPAVLTDTHDYTGFGGVYADTVTVWEPGAAWDAALTAFQSGQRAAAPWLVGESAYHYPGHAGKELDDVLTVLLVEQDTPEAAFAALAGGHTYSLRRQEGGVDLRLGEFALFLDDEGGENETLRMSRVGDELIVGGEGHVVFDIVLRVEDLAGTDTPVDIDVVRNGTLHRRIEGTTPLHERWQETLEAGDEAVYYRIIVRAAQPAYLVSNPIFVRRDVGSGNESDPPIP